MDKVSRYRQIVIDILTAHSQIQPVYSETEMQLLFGTTRDSPQERLCQQYQALRAGWLKNRLLN
jgi:XisI protein